MDQAHQFSQRAEPIYNNLKKLSKQLVVDFDNLSNTFYSMGDQYKSLFEITNEIANNKASQDKVFNDLNETYVRLNNISVEMGNLMVH